MRLSASQANHTGPAFSGLYAIELTRPTWRRAVPAGSAVRGNPDGTERRQMRLALLQAASQATGQALPAGALYINKTAGPDALVATTTLEQHQLNRLYAQSAFLANAKSRVGGRINEYMTWVARLFVHDRQPTPVVIDVESGEIRVGGRRGVVRGHLADDQRQILDHTLMA